MAFFHGRKNGIPHKPLKTCRYPGCPNLTVGTYCEKHEAEVVKEYNAYERAPNHNKKYGREWQRIRNKYVKNILFVNAS